MIKLYKKPYILTIVTTFMFIFIYTIPSASAQGSFPNCRLGVGGAGSPNLAGYDLGQLNMGVYLDWLYNSDPNTNLSLPTNIEYFQVVHVKQFKTCGAGHCFGAYLTPPSYNVTPDIATITSIAQSRPGMLWFIGNEIDRIDWDNGNGTYGGQDEITAELYATAYHEIQQAIKMADPTARVGIGSVILASPLRLQYLDRVWDAYFNQYGYTMGNDIDVWNIHGFLLREVRGEWGADVPAGLDNSDADLTNDYDPSKGFLIGKDLTTTVSEHHNIERFKEFTVALRTWMAEHGERDKPLINTEFGVLFKSFGNITDQQVNDYMNSAFDYLLTATDASIGFPADENKLVQSWVWYSLNDTANFNGNLFDPNTKALSAFGTNWKNYVTNPTKPLASQPQRNLLATNLRTTPEYYIKPGKPVTFTLQADIGNSGNIATNTGNNVQVSFWDKDPIMGGANQIGTTKILKDLSGCGGFETVKVDWPNRVAGENQWYVKVEELSTGETNSGDNIVNQTAFIFDPEPNAELELIKTVNNSTPIERFDTFNYTITVKNSGPDLATNVIVKDVLPNGIAFASYSASQGNYYTSGPWIIGNMANGAQAVLTITAKVENGFGGKTITNTAVISNNDSIDVKSSDDTAVVSIQAVADSEVYLPAVLKSN